MGTLPDPADLQLKVGFEIHQQLAADTKLFCKCSCEDALNQYYVTFDRKLRPSRSEMGGFDPAALFESSRMRTTEYAAAHRSSCLVEADEEPPCEINKTALESTLIFSLALRSRIMDEIHVMRKIVIDGSNTSGFQRTMLVATGGELLVGEKKVGIQSICLEEDASKLISDDKTGRKYGLDRLGVPLVEIALEPVSGMPEEIKHVALTLGRLLRASKRVGRGLGTIRQDVNVSILGGPVVEVKGVQQLDQLVPVIEFEAQRQYGLVLIANELRKRIPAGSAGDRYSVIDVTKIFADSDSKIVRKILESGNSVFKAMRAEGFAGMLGFEPFPGVRLGRELGKLVGYYRLSGVFHSDELPNYGIDQRQVDAVREVLKLGPGDAFVIVGGPSDSLDLALFAIRQRLEAAFSGVTAETRAATSDGQTTYLRPRPGSARMYPETDIPPVRISDHLLSELAGKVPLPWDELVKAISAKYSLNSKLSNQLLDSDFMDLFDKLVATTGVNPTFAASKLTEDLTSLRRKGYDVSALTNDMILEVFTKLSQGQIAKESVIQIFEVVLGGKASTVQEAISKVGAKSLSENELSSALDRIIDENIEVVKSKGLGALSAVMGRAMAELRGKADGQRINLMLKEKISGMVSN
ncbi:MAG: Glu-tRNA(Gln) amidotransferase subunit GatE [Nitrososphaera sp.]